MGDREGRSWLRYGCFGCLGAVGLLLILSLGVLAVAWVKASGSEPVDRTVEQALPVAPGAPGAPDTPGAETGGGPSLGPGALRGAGRVELDLAGAEFRVRPAPPGTPLRVEGRFDENAARLVDSFEEAGDGTWIYRVQFEKTESGLITALKQLFGAESPRVEIFLPRDAAMDLFLEVSRGGVDAELGGLDLRALEIRLRQGGGAIDFPEPTVAPLERMVVDVAMGGFALDGVGNASPKVVDIEFNMGGAGIDLSGAWRGDSEITVRNGGMGGGGLQLPSSGVRLEGVPGGDGISVEPPEGEIPLPVLRFTDRTTWDTLEYER